MARISGTKNKKGSVKSTQRARCEKCGKRRYVEFMDQIVGRRYYSTVKTYKCKEC